VRAACQRRRAAGATTIASTSCLLQRGARVRATPGPRASDRHPARDPGAQPDAVDRRSRPAPL